MGSFKRIIEIDEADYKEVFARKPMNPIREGFNTATLEIFETDGIIISRIIKITCCDDPNKVDKVKNNFSLGNLISAIAPIRVIPTHENDSVHKVTYTNKTTKEKDEA